MEPRKATQTARMQRLLRIPAMAATSMSGSKTAVSFTRGGLALSKCFTKCMSPKKIVESSAQRKL